MGKIAFLFGSSRIWGTPPPLLPVRARIPRRSHARGVRHGDHSVCMSIRDNHLHDATPIVAPAGQLGPPSKKLRMQTDRYQRTPGLRRLKRMSTGAPGEPDRSTSSCSAPQCRQATTWQSRSASYCILASKGLSHRSHLKVIAHLHTSDLPTVARIRRQQTSEVTQLTHGYRFGAGGAAGAGGLTLVGAGGFALLFCDPVVGRLRGGIGVGALLDIITPMFSS